MATIFQPPAAGQAPQQASQAGQALPQASQGAGTGDPLFEALAKYITTGPGPSYVSAPDIEKIIAEHSQQDGGRAYLESIIQPPEDEATKIWTNHGLATGVVSTTFADLTLHISVSKAGEGSPQGIVVHGNTAPGYVYPIQVCDFKEVNFYWNDLQNRQVSKFKIRNHITGRYSITLYEQSSNDLVAAMTVTSAQWRLPREVEGNVTTFELIA